MASGIAALEALVERLERPRWDLREILTAHQYKLATDPSPTVACTGGRRCGKSFCAACKGIDVCLAGTPDKPRAAVYIAATRASAKRMVWKPLLELNRKYQLGGDPNLAELTLTFPNGSTFYVIAVDSEAAADKVRGIPNLYWAAIDEAQRYRPDVLAYLLRDVLRAGQLDALADAQMWLLGTPNPVGKVGAFWERWSNSKTSRHHFTVFENTKLGTPAQIEAAVTAILVEENQTKDSPWYRTEIMAEWGAVDKDKRVYKFDGTRNVYQSLPELTHYIFCCDIGSTAADAVGVLGWNDDDPIVYLVEERIQKGQDDVELGNVLAELAAIYDPILIVADAGGGGAKTVLTLQHLHPELPIVEAEKPPVVVQINVLNGLLKTGRFLVDAESTFAKDIVQISWVDGVVNGKPDESSVHSDILPACRYGAIKVIPLLPEADTRDDLQKQRDADERRQEIEYRKALAGARRDAGRPVDDEDDDEGSDLISDIDIADSGW